MRIPKKKIEKWFRENILVIVSSANGFGWGDTAYRDEFDGIVPKELKPFIGNIHVPRHRDGEYDGDFVIHIRNSRKDVTMKCSTEVLAMCKAHTNGESVTRMMKLINSGDYEQWYRRLRKEIYSKN